MNDMTNTPPPPPLPGERHDVTSLVHLENSGVLLDFSEKDAKNKKRKGLFSVLAKKSTYPRVIRKFTNSVTQITQTPFIIGRRPENALPISDNPNISIMHATISKINGIYFLEDMKSTNKTILEGILLEPYVKHELQNGSRFTIANEVFEFRTK